MKRLVLIFFLSFAGSVWAKGPTTAVLVDKKSHQLFLAEYDKEGFRVVQTVHVTLGKVEGDKEVEGDLKTPEGIYTLSAELTPPALKAKFGVRAFTVDYPNAYDRIAGRNGSHIMLHATNEPDRLKQDYDSEGCVVVKNEEIDQLKPRIRVGLTPILIFAELTPEFLKPGAGSDRLMQFFRSWVSAWEGKDLETYVGSYHTDFQAQGKNKDQWRAYKRSLNQRYGTIHVGPEDVRIYRHPKYSMITFSQNYHSTLGTSKAVGHRSRGTKILTIAEEQGQPKIIAETYTTLMW